MSTEDVGTEEEGTGYAPGPMAGGPAWTTVHWVDWLAATGYGVDFHLDGLFPPCTLRRLAEAWRRRYPRDEDPVEDWMAAIEDTTGPWPADRRG